MKWVIFILTYILITSINVQAQMVKNELPQKQQPSDEILLNLENIPSPNKKKENALFPLNNDSFSLTGLEPAKSIYPCAFPIDRKNEPRNDVMEHVFLDLSHDDNLHTLDTLENMPVNEDTLYAKAIAYYNMQMFSDSKKIVKTLPKEKISELDYSIKKAKAFVITPSYTFLNQELTDVYDLDIRKVGINLSQYGAKNTRAFIDYGMYVYISGNYNDNHLSDFVNEIIGGVERRASKNLEYRIDLGVKAFQIGGALLNTNSWVKYYKNDKFNLKAGFMRNNAEQSYLSAVGYPINGVFTGRAAFNRAYFEVNGTLPKGYLYSVNAGGGAFTAQNLPTNAYMDGTATIEKRIYNNPKNKWIQTIDAELMTYNASYQMNLLNIANPYTANRTFGGYFSPSFTSANSINLDIEGEQKKWRLKYGLRCYAGGQIIYTPDSARLIYGLLPFISWDLNDHVRVNLSYAYTHFSTFLRHYALISVEIRGFKK